MNLPERPITVLIAALGGEGGGVLADWVLAAAGAEGYPVQSTSIPGVAQRTGATTYYLEIYPAKTAELGERRPVMTLAPAPGYVDVMVASELLEAARALQNGFVTPDRTTLIASTHRIYTTIEKMAMGDGRLDSERILKAAQALARRTLLFDMQNLARDAGTVISAAMFGALAGSAALPLPRAACEAAIRGFGKGAEASLRGFAAGYAQAAGEAAALAPAQAERLRAQPLERVRRTFPAETHAILEEGTRRCIGYQDSRYGALYLDRLEPIAKLEREHARDGGGFRLTDETGRFLALWMCYEDVIRVADLKTRRSRFERVRKEVQAAPGEPLHIVEFLKPGLEEVAALLPRSLSHRLVRWARRRGIAQRLNVGMQVKTTSVSGFLMLRSLAWLRPWRRMSARYTDEQALIERWLGAIRGAVPEPALALEIALCGRLIKGYGETHQRGKDNFLRIMDTLIEGGALADAAARAAAVREAREAALADPEGRGLEGSLAAHGIAPLPPKAKPLRFMRRAAPARKAA
ncbi:MAG TPA: indolepyruvate oxidoreductase subunit beta family protein [Burkholderiales bacterium]|nr:indolepyruvate oxidoreductase subunit beta family protein [Burkholderiales bacterium]